MVLSTMVVGMAYFAYTSSFSVARTKQNQAADNLAVEARWGSFEKVISESRGIVAIGESYFYYADWKNKIHRVVCGDTTITRDGNPIFEGALSNVQCMFVGKSVSDETSTEEELDLDSDGSGVLEQGELDIDASGFVDNKELSFIRLLKVSFVYGARKREYKTAFALRNRVSRKYDIEELELEYLE